MNILIFDLDDTLFPVNSIKLEVGLPLKNVLERWKALNKENDFNLEQIFLDCWKMPLDYLSEKYRMPAHLIHLLKSAYYELILKHDIHPYDDVSFLASDKHDKYLVTTGYEKLQKSKIEKLRLSHLFKEIYVDVPTQIPRRDKKYFFQLIFSKYELIPQNFIVIGDNLNSEIKIANELNMTSVFINRTGKKSKNIHLPPSFEIDNLYELKRITMPNQS